MTEPNDRELEQYLKGDSEVSKRYREASRETAPPELDAAILAQARSEVRRKPYLISRWLTPVALAASVILGVNLGWNVYQADKRARPDEVKQLKDQAAERGFVAEPPAAARAEPTMEAKPRAQERRNAPAPQPERDALAKAAPQRDAPAAAGAAGEMLQRSDAAAKRESETSPRRDRQAMAASPPPPPSAMASAAPGPAPLTESARIDDLIRFVGQMQDATFIRNGDEHSPAEAARHMRLKWENAGDRCATADDFIRNCASRSAASGEPYQIRFSDGRVRSAEEVLRERLGR